MKEHIAKELISALKWSWLIVLAGATFYTAHPKYILVKNGLLRLNTITGIVEMSDGEAIPYGNRTAKPVSKSGDRVPDFLSLIELEE